ncbi:MAG: AtpZ/AtpI family protein [Chloroflexi bacterium]|nr:AtpZ/AtpI family protein [Chloroflexota bacterium]
MPKWVSALKFVGIGAYIGFSIFLGVYVGRLLDLRYGTGALFSLLGLILGLAVATLGVYRMLAAIVKEWQGNDRKDNPA